MSTCQGCGEPIRWAPTAASNGAKRMPLDPEPTIDGNVILDDRGFAVVVGPGSFDTLDVETFMPHHATCERVGDFR